MGWAFFLLFRSRTRRDNAHSRTEIRGVFFRVGRNNDMYSSLPSLKSSIGKREGSAATESRLFARGAESCLSDERFTHCCQRRYPQRERDRCWIVNAQSTTKAIIIRENYTQKRSPVLIHNKETITILKHTVIGHSN